MPDLYDSLRERGCIDPILFRAMVQSLIGDGCPYPTIKALADAHDLGAEQLRQFVRGVKDQPEPKILAAFGLERVVLFAPASVDGRRMAETGTGSGRSPTSAVPKADAQIPGEGPQP